MSSNLEPKPDRKPDRLTPDELEAEAGAALPAKEVLSVPLLDLNVDADIAAAIAAPVDLAVAANANAAVPLDAAASANVLSLDSTAAAAAQQGVMIDQHISGDAIAESDQTSSIDQGTPETTTDGSTGGDTPGGGSGTAVGEVPLPDGTTVPLPDGAVPLPDGNIELPDGTIVAPGDLAGLLDAGLLNLDVDVALDADATAPIAGAVAANANVAAPIDAAVAANIASVNSEAVAVADQTAIINQDLEDVTAEASVEQDSEIEQ